MMTHTVGVTDRLSVVIDVDTQVVTIVGDDEVEVSVVDGALDALIETLETVREMLVGSILLPALGRRLEERLEARRRERGE